MLGQRFEPWKRLRFAKRHRVVLVTLPGSICPVGVLAPILAVSEQPCLEHHRSSYHALHLVE